jgi:MFS family permease
VFTFPGVLLTPILGVLADRWGRKRILVPSLMLFGLAGGACALARDLNVLLILRFFQGIGGASLGSINVTIIGDLYHGKRRGAAMGYNTSVLSVGTASYPMIGGALATMGWFYPFLLPLTAIPIGLVVLKALNNPEPRNDQQLREYLGHAWQSVKHRKVVGLYFASLATFIVLYGAYLTYLPFLIEESFNTSPFVIGLAMSVMSVATAVTSSQLGRMMAVFSEATLVKASFVLYAFALAVMPYIPTLWALLIPISIFGIAHGMNIPSVQTLLAGLAPVQHRAAFMSFNGTVLRLGQTLGPILIGAAFSLGGTTGALYAGAGVAIAMSLVASLMVD